MTEYSINPINWYSTRELEHTPRHFTLSNTPLTKESKIWIMNKLVGRYSIVEYVEPEEADTTNATIFGVFGKTTLDFGFGRPAFEDPKEAMFYELTWS